MPDDIWGWIGFGAVALVASLSSVLVLAFGLDYRDRRRCAREWERLKKVDRK